MYIFPILQNVHSSMTLQNHEFIYVSADVTAISAVFCLNAGAETANSLKRKS